MDVLGGNKNEYGLFRRRLRIDTPEINTYQRQILFCEKKCDKLNQKFRISEIKHGATFADRGVHEPPSAECKTRTSVASRNSRKNSIDTHRASLQRRKSSLQLNANRKQQSKTPCQKWNTNRVPSPQKHTANCCAPERCSSQSNNTRRVSRRESESITLNGADKEKNSWEHLKNQEQDSENGRTDAGLTSAVLEELNFAIRRERDQFLRALTTLAINRITTENPRVPPVGRSRTITYYERNVDVLADGSRLTLDGDHVAPHLANDNNNKDNSSVSTSSGSDIYGAIDGDNIPNPDKRERINRLRSYLKCSGFGNPNIVTTTVEQSEDEKRAFSRLIKRINRGLSCESQERLRRKARLEYEMSLMKGESFCEQQEQVYMRTASAYMENRDLQLLEEELRIQALREIRQNKKQTLNNQKTFSRQQSNSRDFLNREHQRHDNQEISTGDRGANNEEDGVKPELDEKSSSDDRDAMSGLIRNPVSRREMRKRILLWVYDVEEAMGSSQKEGEKLEKKLLRNDNRHCNDSFVQDGEFD